MNIFSRILLVKMILLLTLLTSSGDLATSDQEIDVSVRDIFPGEVFGEKERGIASGNKILFANQKISIFKSNQLLKSQELSKNFLIGSPLWTEKGVWFLVKKTEDFITNAVGVVYFGLSPNEKKFEFYENSFLADKVRYHISILIKGSDDEIVVVCVPDDGSDPIRFVLRKVMKKNLKRIPDEQLNAITEGRR